MKDSLVGLNSRFQLAGERFMGLEEVIQSLEQKKKRTKNRMSETCGSLWVPENGRDRKRQMDNFKK
jgi:hypothetical protein